MRIHREENWSAFLREAIERRLEAIKEFDPIKMGM